MTFNSIKWSEVEYPSETYSTITTTYEAVDNGDGTLTLTTEIDRRSNWNSSYDEREKKTEIKPLLQREDILKLHNKDIAFQFSNAEGFYKVSHAYSSYVVCVDASDPENDSISLSPLEFSVLALLEEDK